MEISSSFEADTTTQELCFGLEREQLLARLQNDDANITDLLIEQNWEYDEFIDEEVSFLCRLIGRNTHVQEIELNGPGLIRPYERDWDPAEFSRRRWRLLAEGMKENRSIQQIVFVDFREHVWDVVRMLGPFFTSNPSLEKVHFSDSQGLRQHDGGLQCLLSLIFSRIRPLNEIVLGFDDMNDDMVRALVSAFVGNAPLTPKKITLSPFAEAIGSNGFECLAGMLDNSACKIEELALGGQNFGGAMARLFGNALKENNILRVLAIRGNSELSNNSDSGLNSFESVVCDRTSIHVTYFSNHTLISLGEFPVNNNPLSEDLRRHLEWNCDENKPSVARKKVLACHLMVDSDTNPLNEFGSSLLMDVIEFVDKVIKESGGEEGIGIGSSVRFSFLFTLLKCNPTMCQS